MKLCSGAIEKVLGAWWSIHIHSGYCFTISMKKGCSLGNTKGVRRLILINIKMISCDASKIIVNSNLYCFYPQGNVTSKYKTGKFTICTHCLYFILFFRFPVAKSKDFLLYSYFLFGHLGTKESSVSDTNASDTKCP